MSRVSIHGEIDRIRYNANITFSATDLAAGRTGNLKFSDNRVNSLIDHADDWYITVTRLKIPLGAIPIFVMEMETGSSTDTIYTVTIRANGLVEIPVKIIYVPHNNHIIGAKDDAFFYVYHFTHMIDMINTALATAFTQLKTTQPGITQTEAPYFIYDHAKQIISLISQIEYVEGNADDTFIFFNSPLYERFIDSIDTVGFTLGSAEPAYRVIIKDNFDNGYTRFGVPAVFPPVYLRQDQEYNTWERWTSLDKILIQTQLIPVQQDSVGTRSNEGRADSKSILTDFEPNFGLSPGSSRSILTFTPNGPYRLINLTSHTDLRRIDFQIKWQDTNGIVRDLRIRFNENASLQLTFIKKSTYSGA